MKMLTLIGMVFISLNVYADQQEKELRLYLTAMANMCPDCVKVVTPLLAIKKHRCGQTPTIDMVETLMTSSRVYNYLLVINNSGGDALFDAEISRARVSVNCNSDEEWYKKLAE